MFRIKVDWESYGECPMSVYVLSWEAEICHSLRQEFKQWLSNKTYKELAEIVNEFTIPTETDSDIGHGFGMLRVLNQTIQEKL